MMRTAPCHWMKKASKANTSKQTPFAAVVCNVATRAHSMGIPGKGPSVLRKKVHCCCYAGGCKAIQCCCAKYADCAQSSSKLAVGMSKVRLKAVLASGTNGLRWS